MRITLAALLATALLLPSLAAPVGAQTTEADVYVAQAILDFDARQYEQAVANLTKALEIEPGHVEALYYLGVVHMARRQPAAAIPHLEQARAKSPKNLAVAMQLGLAYLAEQQYDRAQPLLEEVFRTDPTQDGVGYYVGFMRYRNKDYRGALRAFRAGQSSDPQLQQLTRFYTGLALAVLGLPAQASAEVEQALRLSPGSPLTGPAERLRDTIIAARDRRRRFTAEVRLGFLYDDNVRVIPGHDREEPLVPILRRPRHESSGELFGLRADYVVLRTEAFDASVGYSFFGTYNNDLPSFNIMDHLGTLGVVHRTAIADMPTQVSAQYAFDVLLLDEREFVRRHTATLAAVLLASQRHLSQVFGRYQAKDFTDRPPLLFSAEDRDADNWMGGVLHILRFAEDRHFIKGGFQYDYEDTVGRNYAYRGYRFLAGAQYTLPWWAIRLQYDFDVHVRDYTHRNTLLPSTNPNSRPRQDEEITNIVRAELPLPHNFTLSTEYQSTMNHSNLAIFDYTRNVVSITLSWTY